jgi:flavin-binding protein dodecin
LNNIINIAKTNQEIYKYQKFSWRVVMSESVYKIIELVGTSAVSWEDAAKNAVALAGKTLIDLRVAEVTKLDMKIENGKVAAYRARISLSIKYDADMKKW